jgi:hypothetical protein
MIEKVQLVSDLLGLIRVAKANVVPTDLGTLVGMQWGLASVATELFETAVSAVPGEDVLLRLSGTSLKLLDPATGTVEYASLEVVDIGA